MDGAGELSSGQRDAGFSSNYSALVLATYVFSPYRCQCLDTHEIDVFSFLAERTGQERERGTGQAAVDEQTTSGCVD
jgi:hypothetical protein